MTGVVVDTAWPAWLGPEAWLQPWVAERVVTHVRRVLDELGDRVDALIVFSQPDALIARVATGGALVLSGLVGTDVPEIVARYGPKLEGRRPEVYARGEWRAVVWTKNPVATSLALG